MFREGGRGGPACVSMSKTMVIDWFVSIVAHPEWCWKYCQVAVVWLRKQKMQGEVILRVPPARARSCDTFEIHLEVSAQSHLIILVFKTL